MEREKDMDLHRTTEPASTPIGQAAGENASPSSRIIIAETKRALYFGCSGGYGHYLHVHGRRHIDTEAVPGFPWNIGHLDGGLLKKERRDVTDGRVFWTCGGTPLWLAFYWWDRSIDHRRGSNSGFYVQGFDVARRGNALEYACAAYPEVYQRQRFKLVLQG